MKNIAVTLLFISQLALGQSAPETIDIGWLQTIRYNAIEDTGGQDQFQPANSGYALYFSKVGKLEVPYLVYVPQSYKPEKSYPVVVYLHGGVVSISDFLYYDPEFADEPVFSIADKHEVLVVFPFAKKDFGWVKQEKAFENILTIIDQVKQTYHVNEQKVYLGGMSNGATAAFWFISNHPEQFAGFYAFSPFPELKAGKIKFENISPERPLYSINAVDDSVFPYKKVKRIYNQHKKSATAWHFDSLESGDHGFIYQDNGEAIVDQLIGKLLKHESPGADSE